MKQSRFETRVTRRPQDVDLRGVHPGAQLVEETSQDGIDNNIKIIMTQAQEQLDSKQINLNEYNDMIKQVIQLNEKQKVREAERREMISIRKKNGFDSPIEPAFSSDSDSDSDNEYVGRPPFKRSRFERRSHFQHRMQEHENNRNAQQFSNSNDQRRDPRRQPWGDQVPQQQQQQQRMQGPPGVWKQQRLPFNRQNVPRPWQQTPGMPQNRFMGPRGAPFNRMPMNNGSLPIPPIRPEFYQQPPQQSPMLDRRPEPMLTLKIDGIAREIRFYNDVALVFMDWDQPKEIGFQPGERRVSCDGKFSIVLQFNQPSSTWIIDGVPHKVRIGCPTRELYIDNKWYECYFGDPCNVELDGQMRVFRIDGPPPQVQIGGLRRDLVAGKINMIVDAKISMPVYLDGREQTFELDGQLHTLQFADYLLTVLINKEPHTVEFGDLPKRFTVGGQQRFIRFTALPMDIVPGQAFIRDMIRTDLHRSVPSPPNVIMQAMVGQPPPGLPLLSMPPTALSQQMRQPPPPRLSNGLDMLANLLPITSVIGNDKSIGYSQANEKVPVATADASASSSAGLSADASIAELLKNLIATGVLSNPITSTTDAAVPKSDKKEAASKSKAPVTEKPVLPVVSKEKTTPVHLNKPETIKRRQLGIIQPLYSGMQCYSCAVRFPPEQTIKYSQHLDWHFRQNRKDRDSARKAHSKKWYYDVNSWLQYKEIEDMEERGELLKYK